MLGLTKKDKKIFEPLLHEGGGDLNQTVLDQTVAIDSDESSVDETLLTNYDRHIMGLPMVSRMDRQHAFLVNDDIVIYSKKSCFQNLDNESRFRYNIVWIINQKWFDGFILLLIFVNSVLMGMKDFLDKDNLTPTNQFIERLDPYFNTIIVCECVIKIIGMGFINGRNSYLRDGWNWLDFFVVMSTLGQQVAMLIDPGAKESAFAAFRAVRLLRPLRLLGRIQSLKVMITTLIGSVQTLSGTMGLALFFYVIFGILGITIWSGHIHYRCYATEKPENGEWKMLQNDEICSLESNPCPEGYFCRSKFEAVNDDGTPYKFNDPNLWSDTMSGELFWGFNNFDNIGFALLTIFQVTTMDGWTVIMNIYENAGSPAFSWLYYISCVIICSFFILNLTIAQMMMKYALVSDQSDVVDEFDQELYQIADGIFGPEHKKLADFIIQRDYIEIEDGAKKYLKKKATFWESFAESQKVKVDQEHKYYNLGVVQKCLRIVQDPGFNKIMLAIILLNTFILSLDKYPDYGPNVEEFFSILNIFFVFFFTTECILKIVALGLRTFLYDGFNVFDLLVVISSIQGIYFEYSGQKGSTYFLILRTLRVFRILKLFRIGDLRVLIDSITYTLPIILPYIALLVFFMYIFALVGMSFYAGQIRFDENGNVDVLNGTAPREVYDSLGQSFLTIFQVLMGAEWRFIWYQHMMSCGMTAAFYYVFLIIIIGIIMLNLFLAIMLGNFDKARIFSEKKNVLYAFQELMNDEKNGLQFEQICDAILGCCSNHVKYDLLEMKKPAEQQTALMKAFGKKSQQIQQTQVHDHRKKSGVNLDDTGDYFGHEKDITAEDSQLLGYFQNSSFGIFHIDSGFRMICLKLTETKDAYSELMELRKKVKALQKGEEINEPILDKSPSIKKEEPEDSWFEANKIFDGLILFFIIISSLMLPLDNPLNDPDAEETKTIEFMNEIFTIIFVTELTIKTIAKGVFSNNLNHIDPYLKSSWNQIDCFVVFVSVSDIALKYFLGNASSQFSAFKALRALRALRPLRVIRSFPQLKKVVNAFFSSISAISNIIMIGLFILLIFAVIGVSLFKGKYYTCSGTGPGIVTKDDCIGAGLDWTNNDSNFDNIIQAMRTLFILTTTEGWAGVMYMGIDAVGVDKVQVQDRHPGMVIYFISFMICGALFVMNMFVGVVIDNFNKEKDRQEMLEDQDGSGDLKTFLICQAIAQRKKKLQKKCKPPNGWRGQVYELVHRPVFDQFIILIVVLNTVALMSKSYQMNIYMIDLLEILNYIFAFIFNIEMILKLCSDGHRYFLNNWNLFDMFIVLSADIGIVLEFYQLSGSFKSVSTVFRALRILRIAKLLKEFENIRVILDSVVVILPNISNVMCLFVLILYIYACIGIYLFAGAKRLAELNKYNNFTTFGRAMLGLTRYSTGEDFQEFMYEFSNTDNCDATVTFAEVQANGFQGCGSTLAIPYFMSFQVIAGWLILNLTVAAVIDGLNEAQTNNDKLIGEDHIEEYLEKWQDFDVDQTFIMNMEEFFYFLAELPCPFTEKGMVSKKVDEKEPGWLYSKDKKYKVKIYSLFKMISEMKIEVEKPSQDSEPFVKFDDVTKALVYRTLQNDKNKQDVATVQTSVAGLKEGSKKRSIEKKKKGAIINMFTRSKTQGGQGSVDIDRLMTKHLAAIILQQHFREKKAQRASKNK